MHSGILIKAFEKAGKDIGSEIINRQAKHLSMFIQEDSGEAYGEKSLINYYNRARADSFAKIEFKQYVVQSLCNFLGYTNFEEFKAKNPLLSGEKTKGKKDQKRRGRGLLTWAKHNRIWLSIFALTFTGTIVIFSLNKECWMIWKDDHYEEIDFDAGKLQTGELKLCKEERIKNFKQVTPDCNYSYFKEDGNVKVWYGKNKKGEIEYFSDLGLHPTTGKTLKPITKYMIVTHICSTYDN
jgi:hypothetical protein